MVRPGHWIAKTVIVTGEVHAIRGKERIGWNRQTRSHIEVSCTSIYDIMDVFVRRELARSTGGLVIDPECPACQSYPVAQVTGEYGIPYMADDFDENKADIQAQTDVEQD